MKLGFTMAAFNPESAREATELVIRAEQLGYDSVWFAETWAYDCLTPLGYLAAKTDRIKLGTGIMQVGARVPAMIAMSALSLDALSGGRFILGLGVSGPNIVEGLHGGDYSMPLTRLRETVEICRMAWAGEKLNYAGKKHQLPRPGGEAKAMRLGAPPANIPVYLATLSPASLEYTGAAADGWLGTSFSPDHAEVFLEHIERGAKSVGRQLSDIDLMPAVHILIGDDPEQLIRERKAAVAFNMGGMGTATKNFYNEAYQRAGFVEDARAVQALWLEGKREEAVARVPDEMVTTFQTLGTPDMILQKLRKYKDIGMPSLNIRLDASKSHKQRMEWIEIIADLNQQLDQ